MVTLGDATTAGAAASCLACAEWAGLGEASAAALVLVAAIVGRIVGDGLRRMLDARKHATKGDA